MTTTVSDLNPIKPCTNEILRPSLKFISYCVFYFYQPSTVINIYHRAHRPVPTSTWVNPSQDYTFKHRLTTLNSIVNRLKKQNVIKEIILQPP